MPGGDNYPRFGCILADTHPLLVSCKVFSHGNFRLAGPLDRIAASLRKSQGLERWAAGRNKPPRIDIGLPATERQVAEVEAKLRCPIPSSFRKIFLGVFGRYLIEWQLRETAALPQAFRRSFLENAAGTWHHCQDLWTPTGNGWRSRALCSLRGDPARRNYVREIEEMAEDGAYQAKRVAKIMASDEQAGRERRKKRAKQRRREK